MSLDTRTCANCSHLAGEHKTELRRVIGANWSHPLYVRGYCHCCDCPAFVPEPDDEASFAGVPSDGAER